jgi:hypothetical protein
VNQSVQVRRQRESLALPVVFAVAAAWGCHAQVAIRAASPDGQFVAVCRALPTFDGPDYEVRLERPNGAVVAELYEIGDGDPCDEVGWAPDGSVLAVLTGHVARVRFVDIAWALAHPEVATHNWSWRQVDLSTADHRRIGRHLRFVGAREVEVEIREASGETEGGVVSSGSASFIRHRFAIPEPVAIVASSTLANPRLNPTAAAGR